MDEAGGKGSIWPLAQQDPCNSRKGGRTGRVSTLRKEKAAAQMGIKAAAKMAMEPMHDARESIVLSFKVPAV
jgi:hypothetical protein